MAARIQLAEAAPGAMRAVVGLERHVSASVDHTVLALVKLPASVINGCAYCVDMHSRDALAAGERSERLFAVAAWHDAACFTGRERAVLALTDAVTRIADGGVSDEVWADARRYWSETELGELIVAIGTINLWNRIAITSHSVPESHRAVLAAGG
jgi:AhpD family alkylhydroperoxidase